MPSFEVFDCTTEPEVIEVLTGAPGIQGPPGPPGAGTVVSVNGQTGPAVTLTAADVAALPIDAILNGGTY